MVSLENSLKNITRSTKGSEEYLLGMSRINEKIKILQDMVRQGRNLSPETYQQMQTCLFGQVCKTPFQTINEAVRETHRRTYRSMGEAIDYATNSSRGTLYSYGTNHNYGSHFCGKLNCTIYAERVTAMVRSKTGADLQKNLNLVRFHGRTPSGNTYSHMPSLWLKESQRLGVTQDITASIGGTSTRYLTRNVDQGAFLKASHLGSITSLKISMAKKEAARRALRQLPRDIAANPILRRQQVTLPYVSAEDLLTKTQMVRSIPNGTRFSTVIDSRKGLPNLEKTHGTDLMVQHVGFVFQRDGKTYIRHSSPLFDQQVREDLFEEYVRKYIADVPYRLGMHFEKILAP